MTDPRYIFNERLGSDEFYPGPSPEPDMDPPDDGDGDEEDDEYDPYVIDEHPHWQEVADEAKALGI